MGIASLWIISPERVKLHLNKIKLIKYDDWKQQRSSQTKDKINAKPTFISSVN